MMDAHDQKYISRNIEKNILFIPIDDEVTLNFDLSLSEKSKLVQTGYQKSEAFLQSWPN